MKILVITSCTRDKRDCPVAAAEMYIGAQQKFLMEGLKQVWKICGKQTIDLAIISAKYGLLDECDVIAPYNVTFSGLNKADLLARSNSLQLHKHVETLIAGYDLVFFLLGKEYVQVLQLPFEVPDTVTQIFLLGDTHRKLIPDLPNIYFISAGKSLAREFNTTCTTLKGLAFRKLCEVMCCKGFHVFKQIEQNPERLYEILHNQ